eukprot:6291355-Prymnesium_polylepis.1
MGRPSAASARICAPRALSRSSRPASPQARTAPHHTGAIAARRSAWRLPTSMPHRRAAPPPV